MQKLFDQALSLGILAIISYVFWRELKSVKSELKAYMEQDRKIMIDVIERNTRCMERLEDHLDKRL